MKTKIIYFAIRISFWVFFGGIILTIINFAFWKIPVIAAVTGLFAFLFAFVQKFKEQMEIELKNRNIKW